MSKSNNNNNKSIAELRKIYFDLTQQLIDGSLKNLNLISDARRNEEKNV